MKILSVIFALCVSGISAVNYNLNVTVDGDNQYQFGGVNPGFPTPLSPTLSGYDLRGAIQALQNNYNSIVTGDQVNINFDLLNPTISLNADLPSVQAYVDVYFNQSGTTKYTVEGSSQFKAFTLIGIGFKCFFNNFLLKDLVSPAIGFPSTGPNASNDSTNRITVTNVDFENCRGYVDSNYYAASLDAPSRVPVYVNGSCSFTDNFVTPAYFESANSIVAFARDYPTNQNTIYLNNSQPDEISFGGNFFTNILEKNGSGTVTLKSTTKYSDLLGYYLYSTYQADKTNIHQGSIILDTSNNIPIEGLNFPFYKGQITVYADASFGGCGTWTPISKIAPFETLTYKTNSTLVVNPGLLLTSGKILTENSTKMNVTVAPGAAPTLFLAAEGIYDATNTSASGFSNIDLTVNFQPGVIGGTPSIYTLVYSKDQILTDFNSITVVGAPQNTVFTPQVDPVALVYPINIPTGISTADVYFGSQSKSSVVLSDPCGGIIILALGTTQAALDAFATGQAYLTIQALGGAVSNLNSQIKSSRSSQGGGGGAVTAFLDTKSLISDDTQPSDATASQAKNKPMFSLSMNLLGQFQSQNSVITNTNFFSSYKTVSNGAILGFDYLGLEDILIGGAATYVYTTLQQGQNAGSQQIYSCLGTFYSSFIFNELSFNLLVTGSYNYNFAKRNFSALVPESITFIVDTFDPEQFEPTEITFQATGLPGGTGRAKFNSYQLTPHFDLNYEIRFGTVSLVPFIQSDCNITFQDWFQEYGAGSFTVADCPTSINFNQEIDSFVAFLLQNEAGVNLYEQIDMKKSGLFVFRQKASYVNRYTIPYYLYSRQVGDTIYSQNEIKFPMQHFFGSSAEFIYRNKNSSLILTYEGLIGSGFMSNAIFARISQDF